jgi:hypothetical protein
VRRWDEREGEKRRKMKRGGGKGGNFCLYTAKEYIESTNWS